MLRGEEVVGVLWGGVRQEGPDRTQCRGGGAAGLTLPADVGRAGPAGRTEDQGRGGGLWEG